jgi:hypothetical protein
VGRWEAQPGGVNLIGLAGGSPIAISSKSVNRPVNTGARRFAYARGSTAP